MRQTTGLQGVDGQSAAHGSLAAVIDATTFCLVTELPRPPKGQANDERDASRAQRTAALTGAYLAGSPVAVGWQRHALGSTISVLVGGTALVNNVGSAVPGQPDIAVNLPPGGRGKSLDAATVREHLDSCPWWMRVTGIVDSLTVGDRNRFEPHPPLRPSLEDTLTAVWREPFAWLAMAVPIAQEKIGRESEGLSRLIPSLRAKASNSEEHAVNLERQEARYRELQRAELSGLWDIHIFAGGDNAEAAGQFAALLSSCCDLEPLPYTLKPAGGGGAFNALLDTPTDDGAGAMSPFRGSTDLLAAVASPPRSEVPGVRMRRRPTFDVTPETYGDIELGTIVDASLADAGPMTLSRETLNRHVFVCGATGSGKSQTIRGLLEAVSTRPDQAIPWLVIEPAKAEYRRMSGRLEGRAKVIAIRPGMPDYVAASLNPLEPESGFPLQTHVDLTRALFLASFQSDEPFPQVLSASLTRCYEELGWDLTLGEARVEGVTPRYPTLGDLQRVARDVVSNIGYGEEVSRNVRGFVDIRLGSLRYGTPGRFFEGGHPIDIGALLDENVVLEIEDVGDDQDKAFLMGTVIIRLVEHLRMRAKESPDGRVELRHLTIIEEAHRLLRRTDERGPAAHAVELFASLLAEVRAYGEGIVIAEQIPSKIIPDVIKNTAVKIVHRLPARDDREAVGATMNLTDAQSEYVVSVLPGSAAVFTDGMDYPALVRIDLGETRENADAVSADPPLAGRFSAACGPDCRKQGGACTLRQMRLAQRLLDEDGRIVLWTELVVLAHIIGLPLPTPGGAFMADLKDLDRRTLDCALAHAVQAAVAARSPGMSRHYSPADLAEHIAAVVHSQMAAKPPSCSDDDHWAWQAGPFRWNHIFLKLNDWKKGGEKGAHPESDSWAGLYGVKLDAENCDAQIGMLNTLKAREAEHRRGLVFGELHPSSLEIAVEAERTAAGWATAVEKRAEALEFQRNWRWTKHYLKPERAVEPATG